MKTLPCILCGKTIGYRGHHVLSVGAGGPDHWRNLVPICHDAHEAIHKKGRTTFANDNPPFRYWLEQAGWTFTEQYEWKPPEWD